MELSIGVNNSIIFVLKQINVSLVARETYDSRYVESYTCEELENYINSNTCCTLFETLRNEEEYSYVRVFFDVDLDSIPQKKQELIAEFISNISRFLVGYIRASCILSDSRLSDEALLKILLQNFTITESTNPSKTSFHLIFYNCYTTLDTLICMKHKLLLFMHTSNNPLVKAIDTAVFRHNTSLRIVGTRKSIDNPYVHKKTRSSSYFKNYLFSYIDYNPETCFYFIANSPEASPDLLNWNNINISFQETITKVAKCIGNTIVNIDELTPENFSSVPLIIDYTTSCKLCRKISHKHPHQLVIGKDCIKIFKSGNPNSCKIKTIFLEGNKLFTLSQQIFNFDVMHLCTTGEHIVWLKDSWRRCEEDGSLITKLILNIRDQLQSADTDLILVPRHRKCIEQNLKDMLIDGIETDTYAEKLQFLNGAYDIATSEFYGGAMAKEFMCTVSTGYSFSLETDQTVLDELINILDDIQPKNASNYENRELYEKILSSCLLGTTKEFIFFFYGETATGKSTTKKLLRSTLNNLFLETGQIILTDQLDKGPNPFLANMHLKRVVFCSELPDCHGNNAKKIRADNIKRLTESCIVGRQCYSNRINNKNHATIIIDTNYTPVFDKVDNAIMRRISLVNFRTHFTNSTRAVYNNNYDTIKPLNNDLDAKIRANYYRHAFLQIMVGWYQKYHIPILQINATPEKIPDFNFKIKINNLLTPTNALSDSAAAQLISFGYKEDDQGRPVTELSIFQKRILESFNIKRYAHEIETFILENRKYLNLSDEYMPFIFTEDLDLINES